LRTTGDEHDRPRVNTINSAVIGAVIGAVAGANAGAADVAVGDAVDVAVGRRGGRWGGRRVGAWVHASYNAVDMSTMGHAGAGSLSGRPGERPQERWLEQLQERLHARLRQAIAAAGGWLPFDRFMAIALYEPGLGYYARGARIFGLLPSGSAGGGSDFVTAPELSPLFGRALARQVAQVLEVAGLQQVVEFGAGSGALAEQLLGVLGERVASYSIVDLPGDLRTRQQQRLAPFGERVRWLDALPERIEGVVLGNEVLDAMPVQLLHWDGEGWFERGFACDGAALAWADRPTDLRPPVAGPFAPGTVTEIHPQAAAFVRTLAERLHRGAAIFVDYGFPEAEYYHPQRTGGTLMCHHAHHADTDPLAEVGAKDITAHVDFTGLALAAQDAGLEVIGYTSQARFLFNCGLAELLEAADLRERALAQKLVTEHEMGELFKVIGFARGVDFGAAGPIGFAAGDRTHRL
jgi:SAM-dependent MidA family methyltransferase